MNTGTRKQAAILRSDEFKQKWVVKYAASHSDYYTYACEYLNFRGLNPDRGHEYGHAWLIEVLPPEVIDEIKDVCTKLIGKDNKS